MDSRKVFQMNLDGSNMIVQMYLGDLSDADLLVRPVPGCNHIAWQLGHLIVSELSMAAGAGGTVPELPAGFAEKHSSDNSKFDSPSAFYPKATYLELMQQARAATQATLLKQSDADFEKESPEQFREYAKTIADLFNVISMHWLMHAGQWAVVRRKLGRAPMF